MAFVSVSRIIEGVCVCLLTDRLLTIKVDYIQASSLSAIVVSTHWALVSLSP